MKRTLRLIVTLVLILAMVGSSTAYAAVESNAYISSFGAAAYSNGDGTITIDFTVSGTGKMEDIGASQIYIYTSGGQLVRGIYYTSPKYSNMMTHNTSFHYSYVTIALTPGTSYYAVVTLYAGKDGGYGTQNYVTNTVTA